MTPSGPGRTGSARPRDRSRDALDQLRVNVTVDDVRPNAFTAVIV